MIEFDHVIVGNSAAGVGAIEALLRPGNSLSSAICLISEEKTPAYSRPFIGHLVDGTRGHEELFYRTADFYEEKNLHFLNGRVAKSLYPGEREVELDGGERLRYGKLLIATGGQPVIPPIPGLKENSYSFIKLPDAEKIKERIDHGDVCSAVVLGGGLIGAAATAALIERGVEVTIVELAPRILSSVLDEEASSIIGGLMGERGVRIITGHTISRVEGDSSGPRSVLDSGEVIESDLLIVAIGVRPRVELVRNTEIAVDRGITVNRKMETNVPGIYAAGDCAQTYDSLREKNMVLALWPTAYMGGRVAGKNMSGGDVELEWSTSMNSMNCFGTSVLSAGIVKPGEEGDWSEIREKNGNTYRKILAQDGVVKGFVLVGDVGKAGLYLQMMRRRTDLRKLGKPPLSEDFGLIHLPTRERRRIMREAVGNAGP